MRQCPDADRCIAAACGTSAVAVGALVGCAAMVTGCGSRSTLDNATVYLGSAAAPPEDAGLDAVEAGLDAAEDAPLPPIESGPLPDVVLTNCSSPSILYIYVVTTQGNLWSFYPPTAVFTPIGPVDCQGAVGTPFSMAVDRAGTAYVEYSVNGAQPTSIYRVSTRDGSCTRTPFVPSNPMQVFGMGFVGDPDGATDTLYIAEPGQLDTLDVNTFRVSEVGAFIPERAELTGTGDGRLFTYFEPQNATSTVIDQVDPTSGAIVASSPLSMVSIFDFAFGYWGGDFYIFNGSGTTSTVTRFSPGDGSQVVIAMLPESIVGAGVSTCAPQF